MSGRLIDAIEVAGIWAGVGAALLLVRAGHRWLWRDEPNAKPVWPQWWWLSPLAGAVVFGGGWYFLHPR